MLSLAQWDSRVAGVLGEEKALLLHSTPLGEYITVCISNLLLMLIWGFPERGSYEPSRKAFSLFSLLIVLSCVSAV